MAAEVASVNQAHDGGPDAGGVEKVGNLACFTFFIAGKPIGKGRPRFRTVPKRGGGHYVQTYTPKATREWEQEIGEQVGIVLARLRSRGALKGIDLPLSGRVILNLRFNLPKPKSAPKKLRFQKKKPDLDNLDKSLIDALASIGLIKDDDIVTDISTCKRFATDAHPMGVEVELTGWLKDD